MGPSVAEVARTLLRGRLRGSLRVNGLPEPDQTSHATDCAGLPMILVRRGGRLDTVLCAVGDGQRGAATAPRIALRVEDVPPLDTGPSLGAATIEGRPRALAGPHADEAVLEFAEANPLPDLFDVGGDVTLYLLEPEHVRLASAGVVIDLDLAEYMAADPDPFHEDERELLLDLVDHHQAEMERYFRRQLDAARVGWRTAPRAVRLDRYGFTLDVGRPEHARPRWVRLSFARPVANRRELANLLHPVLFHSSQ
jgi:hypothetical protein